MAVELERLNNQVIAELVAKHGKEKEDFENYVFDGPTPSF